jgi:hypothetical protein
LSLDCLLYGPFKAHELKPIGSLELVICGVHIEEVLFNRVLSSDLVEFLVCLLVPVLPFFGYSVDSPDQAFFGLLLCLCLHVVDDTQTVLPLKLIDILGETLNRDVVIVFTCVVEIELELEGLLLEVRREHGCNAIGKYVTIVKF